jgi:membrane protease YdiL (CAAX protease family)
MTQSSREVSGFQIAFLIFAVILLSAPAAQWLSPDGSWARENEALVGRLVIFAAAILILVSFPAVREMCKQMLRAPIPPQHRAEVAGIAAIAIIGNFAAGGATALWLWLHGGDVLLASQIQIHSDVETAKALSLAGLLMIPLTWIIAPVVEELVFRGFLYRAWAQRWHWLIAMGLTAATFGLYHPYFTVSFASSVLFTCVMRRTSSLRSAIVVHAVGNATLWFPFLGQFVLPADAGARITSLSTWWLHMASLLVIVLFLPAYVWMARDKKLAVRRAILGTMPLAR